MEMCITEDRRWPIYCLHQYMAGDFDGYLVEIPAELKERYERASKEFDAVQEILIKIFESVEQCSKLPRES